MSEKVQEIHFYSGKYKLGKTRKKYNDAQYKWSQITLEPSDIKSAVYTTQTFPYSENLLFLLYPWSCLLTMIKSVKKINTSLSAT